MLELLQHSNLEKNLQVIIPSIKKKVESYLQTNAQNIKALDFQVLLTQDKIDIDWAIAHAYSILEYIHLFTRNDFIGANLSPDATLAKTKEFIEEFQDINSLLIDFNIPAFYDPEVELFLCYQYGLPMHAKSQNAFVSAKMKSHYEDTASMGKAYDRKITPFIIRHALELKIKNDLLNIRYVEKNGKISRIPISRYIEFLNQKGNNFFDLPIDIDLIKLTNQWSNDFIHTGFHEYSWLIFSVIEKIEPLYSTQENGRRKIEGCNFRKKDFDIKKLKVDLEDYLDKGCQVHFSEWETVAEETFISNK